MIGDVQLYLFWKSGNRKRSRKAESIYCIQGSMMPKGILSSQGKVNPRELLLPFLSAVSSPPSAEVKPQQQLLLETDMRNILSLSLSRNRKRSIKPESIFVGEKDSFIRFIAFKVQWCPKEPFLLKERLIQKSFYCPFHLQYHHHHLEKRNHNNNCYWQ